MRTSNTNTFVHQSPDISLRILIATAILIWIGTAFFNTGMFVFGSDTSDHLYEFFYGLRWTLPYHSPWLVIVPCIYYLAKIFPLNEKMSLKNISAHFFFAFLFAFLSAIVHMFVISIRNPEASFIFTNIFSNFSVYVDDRILLYALVLLGFYGFDFYRKQTEESLQELQLKESINREKLNSFKNDIQPAFLIQTLKDIEQVVHDNPEKAEQLIADLAQMIRSMLANSREKSTDSKMELDFLKKYTLILNGRIGRTIRIETDPSFNKSVSELPISLFVISTIEALLERGEELFQTVENITFKTPEKNSAQCIEIEIHSLNLHQSEVYHWFHNGGKSYLKDLFYSSKGDYDKQQIELNLDANGILKFQIQAELFIHD